MQSAKRVGSLAFDPVEGIIWRNGVRISLTPKAAAILSYLVDRPGRIVPLGQILGAVWPGTFVQPEGIKVYIFELRRALGDNAKSPTHIESIQRRGYRLIGPLADLRDRRPSIEISRDVQLPGRRPEFEILDECLGKAREGAVQIVFLDGESGIGKTTLVEAFAASRESEVQVVSGRCIPTQGGQEPYYPVLEALGKVESEDFPRILALHAPTWAMQMPAKFSEQERAALRWQTLNVAPARMLRELCELIEAISQTSLLLFILEDLHWADPATLDFVNTMARRQHARQLLLIGTSLPAGGISAGHPLRTISRELFVKSLCRHIELSPLTPAAVSSILVQELGANDVSEQLVNNVVESSGGNPLFIRSIIERIKEGHGPSLPAGSMDVSEDLKQVILDQFSDLTSEERLLLEYGSVAGASFSGWLIAPLLDSTPDATDARYEAMAESRRFIRIAANGAAGALAFPRFEFTHGPARHLIYGHVGRARRNEIHRAMAARLESAQDGANANAAELAWHYEEHGELRKSGRYLRIAAQQAIERYELHDAIMLVAKAKEFEGALQRPEAEVESGPRIRARWSEAFPSGMDGSVTVEDWERILAAFLSERWGHVAGATSEVLGPMGSFRRDLSFRAVESASPDMRPPSQPGETAPADVNTAYRRLLAARWKAEEVEMVRSAVSELCAHDPDHSLMVGAHLEATRLLVTSDYDASWRLARIARETAWRQQDAVGLRSSGRLFRCALFYAGRWREFLQEGSASLEESEKIGDPVARDISLLQLAHLHAACFDFEGALALCAKLSSLAKSDKHMGETVAALEAVALAGLAKLDPTAAANPILLPNAGDVHRSSQWAMEWAAVETLLDRNAVDEALPRAEVMLQFILATEERSLQAITWEQMARLHLLRGDAPLATQSIRYALALVEGSDLPVAAWRVLHVAAAIARQSGDKDSNAYRRRAKEATKRLAGELEYQKDLQKSFLDGTKRYVESVWATL